MGHAGQAFSVDDSVGFFAGAGSVEEGEVGFALGLGDALVGAGGVDIAGDALADGVDDYCICTAGDVADSIHQKVVGVTHAKLAIKVLVGTTGYRRNALAVGEHFS